MDMDFTDATIGIIKIWETLKEHYDENPQKVYEEFDRFLLACMVRITGGSFEESIQVVRFGSDD